MQERIKFLRKELGLTQGEFAEKTHISRSMMANLENGFREIRDIHISQICRAFNINETWLRTGEGAMFAEQSDDLAEALCEKHNLPPAALSVLHTFLALDEKSRDTVLDFARRLAADLLQNDYDSLSPYIVHDPEQDHVMHEHRRLAQELLAEAAAQEDDEHIKKIGG